MEIIVNMIAKIFNIYNKIYKTDEKNVVILKIKYFKIIKIFLKFYLYKKQYKNKDNK